LYGADFYGLPRHTDTISLRRENWIAPQQLPMADSTLIPLRGGEAIRWRVV
jgi:dihydroorotase